MQNPPQDAIHRTLERSKAIITKIPQKKSKEKQKKKPRKPSEPQRSMSPKKEITREEQRNQYQVLSLEMRT